MTAAVVQHKTVTRSKAIVAESGLGQRRAASSSAPVNSSVSVTECRRRVVGTSPSGPLFLISVTPLLLLSRYTTTEPGRSGLLSEAINLLIQKIMCIGQGLREFYDYRLRLLHCGITWQSRPKGAARTERHPWTDRPCKSSRRSPTNNQVTPSDSFSPPAQEPRRRHQHRRGLPRHRADRQPSHRPPQPAKSQLSSQAC
jgi:hypothetical protein